MQHLSVAGYELVPVEDLMTEEEIISTTNAVFAESFEIESDKLVPDANIFTDLGLDSLDIVDLIVALQSAFGVKIRTSEKVKEIRTLGDVYRFIAEVKNGEQ